MFHVVIPARYSSTRLPGKPLLDIGGMPMIQHVYNRAVESGADKVVIATDDERIETAAKAFGADVCMTSDSHNSGTERLSEVIQKLGFDDNDIVVNLQGDEPMMPATLIHQVAENLKTFGEASVATLAERITNAEELFNPNAVKVVWDCDGYALYFSRAPIPWHRDGFATTKDQLPKGTDYFRHIGLYAYRAGFVNEYVKWPACSLEGVESLEQLRVLWFGRKIHVAEALERAPAGVDTEGDLEAVRQLLN